jgi:GxxExxY protein
MLVKSKHNATTNEIIGAAIDVHRALGPGLLESLYALCLRRELTARGLRFVTEVTIPVSYKGVALGANYRVDLIVEDRVIVEVKSIAAVLPVHKAQVLTYLKLTACPMGLLINFNVAKLVDGVHRLVNPVAMREEPNSQVDQ